jgi:hypothetical protein
MTRQILGPQRFDGVLKAIQHQYGGSSITEPQLESAFVAGLPNHSSACQTRLSQFFTQWFDTAYHGTAKPQITGPALDGQPFYADGCTAPGGHWPTAALGRAASEQEVGLRGSPGAVPDRCPPVSAMWRSGEPSHLLRRSRPTFSKVCGT